MLSIVGEGLLSFHACAPAGEWLNDPNGLVFVDGAFRLFAQHRRDAPEFRETGWARLSSPDLLDWHFDGVVIAPTASRWAYSGCVGSQDGNLEATYTLHESGIERQVRRVSRDGGQSWSPPQPLEDVEAASNRRDPFIFRDGDGWVLLIAEPCDWTDWTAAIASRLRMYRSVDQQTWRLAGLIGPWRPPGIMWEVPVLAQIGGHIVLFISEVDRRRGAACCVRAWIGQIADDDFVPLASTPRDGQLVDLGPDFYALMQSSGPCWPLENQVFVGWLSNWEDARVSRWPGFFGGPISFPRHLTVEGCSDGLRLCNYPAPDLIAHFRREVGQLPAAGLGRLSAPTRALCFTIGTSRNTLNVRIDWGAGTLRLDRTGKHPWSRICHLSPSTVPTHSVLILVDGPVVELFLLEHGVSASIALLRETGVPFSLVVDEGEASVAWFVRD